MATLQIEIWSDIACPWCYVGKRRLEAALRRFRNRDKVEVRWRAFELNSLATRRSEAGRYAERLAVKYRVPQSDAEAMISNMAAIAKAEGLTFDFENIQPFNTFDAHRVLHLAMTEGLQDAVAERFFRGYFTEGQAIGDPAVLSYLAVDAGLPAERTRRVLESDEYAQAVRDDEAAARELGINSVPFFVLSGRHAMSGAQPAELLLRALERADRDLEQVEADFSEGAVCGPIGC
jgi:predicted DsbA family dithiol-disulfide isomerase